MKENPELYLSFAAFCLFSVAVQVFFPYLIIYIQNYLGITDYAIVLGVVLIRVCRERRVGALYRPARQAALRVPHAAAVMLARACGHVLLCAGAWA